MINVKDIVYKGLVEVCEDVSDAYPQDWSKAPKVQYVEEENRVNEWGDDSELSSYIRYRVDIWHNVSTSQTAVEVDKVMTKLGFKRTGCSDVPDPSGFKHKQMRYEAIIDCNKEFIYHPGY